LPGRHASPAQKKRFWRLIESGMSPRQAGLQVGMSKIWGYRMFQGLDSPGDGGLQTIPALERKMLTLAPEPKTKEQLRPEVLRMLQPAGINDWCEAFLARRPVPWRQEAAELVVEWLTDRSEKTFVDVNTPPGAGKSTFFTHDLPAWLVCGGGWADPLRGRAIRMLVGHESKKVSIDYVRRVRRFLELRRPFYDKEQQRSADLVASEEFGRFKPVAAEGEESIWAQDQFLVAQLGTVDLYEKEPTLQAASRQAGFLGERVDFYAWDDIATTKNSRSPEIAEELNRWFEDEAETRLEPGGVGLLVGQRLGPLDLHRKRLDKSFVDDDGNVHQKYFHIIYPAHNEATCDADAGGTHRQWDAHLDGCLLDAERLSWREIQKIRAEQNFRTVYQQEDTDPGSVLVLPVWIDGGRDAMGFDAPGSWDKERGFWEVPELGRKEKWITYATVDPSASNWWVVEVWSTYPMQGVPFDQWHRYLLWGLRAKLQAGGPGGFLDWDIQSGSHVGVMEDVQQKSIAMNLPIRVWVIEANAAHRYLMQYDHFRRWKGKYPYVKVIAHQTQKNKSDPVLGVEARLRMAYRNGQKHLPRSPSSPEALNYTKRKVYELTTYPQSSTDDTVMADWFGETNFEYIVRTGLTPMGEVHEVIPNLHLPPYLRRQYAEAPITR
jgi:hypothetical protein